MTTKFSDICHGEKYEKNGEEKMKWTNIGTLIEKDGKRYVKIKFVPVGVNELFLSVFDSDSRGQQQGQAGQQSNQQRSDPFGDAPGF